MFRSTTPKEARINQGKGWKFTIDKDLVQFSPTLKTAAAGKATVSYLIKDQSKDSDSAALLKSLRSGESKLLY